jgi:hypothetical protein
MDCLSVKIYITKDHITSHVADLYVNSVENSVKLTYERELMFLISFYPCLTKINSNFDTSFILVYVQKKVSCTN